MVRFGNSDIGKVVLSSSRGLEATGGSDSKGEILTGCQAIARGALEANVGFVTGYAGEPATGVMTALEAAVKAHPELGLRFEWSLNEGCAFEKAFAASWTGVKSLVVMKHVGLNVAMDAFQTMSEKECGAGFLIVIGADPGPESSQNSQDERSIIADLGLLGIEPSDPQECLEFTRLAFALSEKNHLPVVIRVNPVVAEGLGPVEAGLLERKPVVRHFRVSKPMQYVTSVPTYAGDVQRRRALLSVLAPEVEGLFCRRNGDEGLRKPGGVDSVFAPAREGVGGEGGGTKGVVYSGLLAGPVEEEIEALSLQDLPRMRLSAFSPFAEEPIGRFLKGLSELLVFEEQMPYLEREIQVLAQRKGMRLKVFGKIEGGYTPFKAGVVNKTVVRQALQRFLNEGVGSESSTRKGQASNVASLLMPRALLFCPGCPHAAIHFALNYAYDEDLKAWRKREPMIRSSDIGCYGSLPSFMGMAELKFHMGGGFGVAAGLVNCELFTTQGGEEVRDPLVVAFAGDSTFFHSSVIRMLDGAANRVPCLYLVFDNKTVALTGLQPVPALPIVELAEAAGVQARVVNSFDVWGSSRAFGEALELVRREKKPMLVVGEGECALLPRAPQITSRRYAVWEEKCDGCGMCVEEFRCPALVRGNVSPSSELGVVSAERARESGEMPKPQIVADICVGCGVCEMVCRYSLTVEGKPREEGAIGPVSTPSTSVEGSSACPPQLGVRSGTQGTRPSTLNSKSSFNIALVGVGGLGLREVAEVIIRAAQSAGHGVVRGFVKGGISERFGAVYGIIRVGSGARTPSLLPGEADVVLALEPLEGLRACEGDLRAPSFASAMRTSIAVSTLTLPPLAVTLGQKRYPLLEEILRVLEEKCAFVEVVSPPVEFQRRPLAHNSYFLGAACHLLEEVIPVERVRKAVVELMPSGLTAFDAGRGGYVGGDRR